MHLNILSSIKFHFHYKLYHKSYYCLNMCFLYIHNHQIKCIIYQQISYHMMYSMYIICYLHLNTKHKSSYHYHNRKYLYINYYCMKCMDIQLLMNMIIINYKCCVIINQRTILLDILINNQ